MPRFDIAVIGGGHAGIEAVYTASRFPLNVAFITFDKNKIGYPSCNPSIGGIAKSHLVYELDVFGGQMPQIADAVSIHSKLLNSSKGPAVWSLRSQIDSNDYPKEALKRLLEIENVTIIEDEAREILAENGKIKGVLAEREGLIETDALIVATGTYLNGRIFIGRDSFSAGRFNEKASNFLSESFNKLGILMMRLKTGTPSRAYRNSIDFSLLEEQKGEDDAGSFSVLSDDIPKNTENCYIGRTNNETHEIIKKNIHLSALYSGLITGIGPKYCPSIEDKVVRFAERDSHTVFIEPMGRGIDLVYINGTSSSLPESVQYEFLRTIKGLKNVKFSQPGYAIEYDALKSHQLKSTLELKNIENLYTAGQINGTSGYEEAAAQGFVAGLNCAMKLLKREEVVFDRYTSYIGVLTDDITKKEITDPYRLFTSRSENRLVLRQDNNFLRMLNFVNKIGIENEAVRTYKKLMNEFTSLSTEYFDENNHLKSKYKNLNDPARTFIKFKELFPNNSRRAALALYSEIKYAGYIERYKRMTQRILESKDLMLGNKEQLFSSLIISKEAKEILKAPDILSVKDLFGRIDPSDIENLLLVMKKKS
ncbi:MAG: tRNA uridine-5-carboxymethylaminomethyl(34) synthesis enzyme MnmG [bacterium]